MIIGLIIAVATDIAYPYLLGKLIDLFSGGPEQNMQKVQEIFLLLVGVYIIMFITWRVIEYAITYFELQGMRDINMRCFQSIQKHSFQFFTNNFTGSLVKKKGRMVAAFEKITDILYFHFLRNSLQIMGGVIMFFLVQPFFSMLFVGWLCFFVLITYFFSKWKYKYDTAAMAIDSKIGAISADSFSNYGTVKMFSGEKKEYSLFCDIVDEWYAKNLFTWNLSNHANAIQGFMMIILEASLIFLMIHWWEEGIVTIGDFVFMQSYLLFLMNQLWEIGRQIRYFFSEIANMEEMTEILNQEIEIQDKKNASDLIVTNGNLVFQNVCFSYQKARPVFQDFSLHIKPGEKVAIVGHSGAGKSTFVKLVFRFFDIQTGQILIDGQNIAEVTQESLRRNISLVPQDPNLFHRTIRENIAYGKTNASEEDILLAAEKAEASEFIRSLPDGYDTLVGERGVKLSGGEKQRIAMARAILENTKILILDEATSSLDSITETNIQKAITNVMKEKTSLVIAHRLSTIKSADRVIVLDTGKIVEEGTHTDLLKKKGTYCELWEHQVGGFLLE